MQAPMSTNTLSNLLNPSFSTDDSIIIPGGPTLSYAKYEEEIERVAGLLAGFGVKPGRPVSIVLPNSAEFMVLFLSVARAGAIAAGSYPIIATPVSYTHLTLPTNREV